MAIGPVPAEMGNLLNNAAAIHIPIVIVIDRVNLTTRMLDKLIKAAEQVALDVDMLLLQDAYNKFPSFDTDAAFRAVWAHENRFVITSVSRGSIIIEGAVLLAIAWAVKHFIAPGWEKSQTKEGWDEWVSGTIDKAGTMIIEKLSSPEQGLKKLKILRIAKKKEYEKNLNSISKVDVFQVEKKKALKMLSSSKDNLGS